MFNRKPQTRKECQMKTAAMYMAMELSASKWKLGFSDGKATRIVNCSWGDQQGLLERIQQAKKKLKLPESTPVYSCYEAGRDGFWIHRFLSKHGINNLVIDAASIEVPRRKRRVKTDRVDAEKLLTMLLRYWQLGERKLWRISRPPSEAAEDDRCLHREISDLQKERTSHLCRIRSLLNLHGIKIGRVDNCDFRRLRDWEGKALPAGLLSQLERERERLVLVNQQLKFLESEKVKRMKKPLNRSDKKAAKLYMLRGIGKVSSWVLSKEFFGWREFKNRRQVGALAGLTGTPYDSGNSSKEQGISKAGNSQIRSLMVELAWGWLRHQPDSELSQWFIERFANGGKRMRRIGIVAMARKLLVALWKFVEKGEVPAGAVLKIN